MGRRKERRHAAISAAGRRVKLDLFAEPPGDVGGSSRDEVEGNGGSKSQAKLPSSPSSSGQQPENPLMLLEQYSDDELDDDSSEGDNHGVTDNASVDMDEKEINADGQETEDIDVNLDQEPTGQCLMDNRSAPQDPSQTHEKGSIAETGSDDLQKQTEKMEEIASIAASDEQPVVDVSSSWKMVLHEESNQYYYWNIATGETSWEVPDIMAEANVMTSTEKVIDDTEGKMDAIIATPKSSSSLDMEECEMTTNQLSIDSIAYCQSSYGADQGITPDVSNEEVKGEHIEDKEGHRDASQSNGISLRGTHHVGKNVAPISTDLSSQLIKQCESLLERLNNVKGMNSHLEGQDCQLKCTVEIETILADIRALASHGSSLLPYWLHSEGQIKRLEAAVGGVIQCSKSASLGEFEATLESRDDTHIGASEKKTQFTAVKSHSEYLALKSNYEASNDIATVPENAPSVWNSSNHPVNGVGGKSEITGTIKESELAPGHALHSGEDVDMDVDMEVDDTSSVKTPPPGGASSAHYLTSTELPNAQYTLADQASTVPGEVFNVAPPSEEWIPPPPPDDEFFPPPPPDDEPFPPPPPDEPPESSYPPVSHLGSAQPFPCQEQYTLSYPGSNLDYYGQTNLEVSASALFTPLDGGQVPVSHLPQYYEAAANIYAVAPMIVNPVEPTPYYGLQNGTLNPVPLIRGVSQSSNTPSEPVHQSLNSGTSGPVNYHPEAGSILFLENLTDVKSSDAPVKAPSNVPEAHFSTGAPATSSIANGVSVTSTSETTTSVPAGAAATTSKSRSKMPRSKKRTVAVVSTLRSNKKVSSLVDKWKAAKEELHEEEEESEDAYEILEKKRKREIEEWRAQQIASGEAKDNANFQPLGGDWRERVKRKRAQRMKESGQCPPDVAADGNRQTDLVELSKDLPSGWQVYWDDSSKKLYYGNTRTSETTWTRPTD